MNKTLFVLTAVVVAYSSFHATADSVSPGPIGGSGPALTAATSADDSTPTSLKASESYADARLPLTILPDNSQPTPAPTRGDENSGHLDVLTGFLQSTGDAVPEQASAQTTALSMTARWGVVLIGASALYMLTLRRNRPSQF